MTLSSDDLREGTDETLMVRYQRGDREAFARLVHRHQQALFTVCRYLLGNDSLAMEVAEGTFMQLVQNAATFHIETRFRPWLYGLLHSLLVPRFEGLRSPRVGTPPASDARRESAELVMPTSVRSSRSPLLTRKILERVAVLPPPVREAILLKRIAGLSIHEISMAADTDPDTVRHRLRIALDQIQNAVADTEDYARALR